MPYKHPGLSRRTNRYEVSQLRISGRSKSGLDLRKVMIFAEVKVQEKVFKAEQNIYIYRGIILSRMWVPGP